MVELPVVWRARVAADDESGAREVAPEADVECDVRVVRVHVEPEVLLLWRMLSWWRLLLWRWWRVLLLRWSSWWWCHLVGAILHHERVVRGEAALCLARVESFGDRVEHMPLQVGERAAHADRVDDDTVIVH